MLSTTSPKNTYLSWLTQTLNTEVVDPLLHSEPSKAQEYLQGLLASADVGFTPVLRRRPVPLTDGPPDADYIVSLNIASLKSTRLYIDHVYRKIAELATLLAGSDIPKLPLVTYVCKPSKATMAGMFPATSIPLPKP